MLKNIIFLSYIFWRENIFSKSSSIVFFTFMSFSILIDDFVYPIWLTELPEWNILSLSIIKYLSWYVSS